MLLGPVDDADAGGAGAIEGVDDAARRSASAEHAHVSPTHLHALRSQGFDEAVSVGRMAGQGPARIGDHCVDATQRRRRRSQLVNGGGDLFFVWRRDGEATDAERAHRLKGECGRAGRDVEGDVGPLETSGGERGVVNGR